MSSPLQIHLLLGFFLNLSTGQVPQNCPQAERKDSLKAFISSPRGESGCSSWPVILRTKISAWFLINALREILKKPGIICFGLHKVTSSKLSEDFKELKRCTTEAGLKNFKVTVYQYHLSFYCSLSVDKFQLVSLISYWKENRMKSSC